MKGMGCSEREMSSSEASTCASVTASTSADCSTASQGGLWQEFDTQVLASQINRTANTDAYIEMCRYMEEKVIPRNEDPFLFFLQFYLIYIYVIYYIILMTNIFVRIIL